MATIKNKTARELMYQWHSGMGSPFYAAASSGLCFSYSALADECTRIDEPDRARLMAWIQKRTQAEKKIEVVVLGTAYLVLPWAHRSYFAKGS